MKKRLLLVVVLLILLSVVLVERGLVPGQARKEEGARSNVLQRRFRLDDTKTGSDPLETTHSSERAASPRVSIDEDPSATEERESVSRGPQYGVSEVQTNLSSPIFVFYSGKVAGNEEELDSDLLKRAVTDVVEEEIGHGIVIDCDALTTSHFTVVVFSKPEFDVTEFIRRRYWSLRSASDVPENPEANKSRVASGDNVPD